MRAIKYRTNIYIRWSVYFYPKMDNAIASIKKIGDYSTIVQQHINVLDDVLSVKSVESRAWLLFIVVSIGISAEASFTHVKSFTALYLFLYGQVSSL